MLTQSTIEEVIEAQRKNMLQLAKGLKREALESLPELSSHALIVSGVRRCGKSTLLYQMLRGKYRKALYLNFEDTRLYAFERNDFRRLDEIIAASKSNVLLFDEIQIIKEWERYVRQKLDEGFRLVVTGSNASLLSRELGTKLTGRHIGKELFPFSYREFCSFTKTQPSEKSLSDYLKTGGFPEYVKHRSDEILQQLFDDILVRDVAVRYGVRDIKTLQQLALYLISNVGKLITGNRLKTIFEVGSTSTIMEYLSHLEYAWLFQFVPRFSHSLRKQLINPRKVYAIDTGLINTNSTTFSADQGRKLENLVFLSLRRRYKELYYFSEKGECDFVVFEKGRFRNAIQICYTLTPDNLDRELNGLMEAMTFFSVKRGTIVTYNQKDQFKREGMTIDVVPSFTYLLNDNLPQDR